MKILRGAPKILDTQQGGSEKIVELGGGGSENDDDDYVMIASLDCLCSL